MAGVKQTRGENHLPLWSKKKMCSLKKTEQTFKFGLI